VDVELEAPPPSPGDYVDMGPVSPNHYLQLQDHLEEAANLTLLYPFSLKQMLLHLNLR